MILTMPSMSAYLEYASDLLSPLVTDPDAQSRATQTTRTSQSSCHPMESGSELIFTNSQDSFPHPPEFLPVRELVPGSDKADVLQPPICLYQSPMHYPHFVQELLRCFSYWQSRPDQPPVLYVPKHQFYRYLTNPLEFDERFPFSSAVLRTLRNSIGLQVTEQLSSFPNDATGFPTQEYLEKDHVVSPFAMASRQDAIQWRNLFVNSTSSESTKEDHITRTALNIGVVNRAGEGRSFLNDMDIRDSLQEAFPQHDVTLQYLENHTFPQTVEFYNQLDVLVSPHGSQLTGIMFMKPCSAVLELFPRLYYTPFYFSSIARVFGLQHANWYVSNGTVPIWQDHPLPTRLANTNNNMCPSLEGVISGVYEMIKRRQECLLDAQQSGALGDNTTNQRHATATGNNLRTSTTLAAKPRAYPEEDLSKIKQTAVVIFTHLIRAHPSLDPLLEIVNGYQKYLKGLPEKAPLFITVDGIKPADTSKGELFLMESEENRDKYDRYLQALQQHFKDQDNVRILVAGKNIGLANNIRRVIQNLSQDTQYMYLLQHDLPFIKEINHTDILTSAEANLQMRLVGFPGEHPVGVPCCECDVVSPAGMYLRRFRSWTDRNHFARVDHYQNDILPLLSESAFPEDSMHKSTRTNCSYWAPYYYNTGKGGPYYQHTDLSERYGEKLAERVRKGQLPYSMLSDTNLMVMKGLGVNMTELEQYAKR